MDTHRRYSVIVLLLASLSVSCQPMILGVPSSMSGTGESVLIYYEDFDARAADGSLTCFAFDPLNYNSPGWHLLVIWTSGNRIITCADRAVFWEGTDSDIATGAVGIGFREARSGAALVGGLVDGIIIDDSYCGPWCDVADWELY